MLTDELEKLLKTVSDFVAPASIAGGLIADLQGDLLSGEEAFVAKAVDKRRREFIAGRTAARRALEMAGGKPLPILSGEHREPIWPDGFTGSITHSDVLCFAACVRADLGLFVGIDVEIAARFKRDLWRMVLSDAECEACRAADDPDLCAAVAFSAKESLEKAQFAASGRVMEMRSMCAFVKDGGRMTMTHEASGGEFTRIPSHVEGRWAMAGDHVFTSISFYQS